MFAVMSRPTVSRAAELVRYAVVRRHCPLQALQQRVAGSRHKPIGPNVGAAESESKQARARLTLA